MPSLSNASAGGNSLFRAALLLASLSLHSTAAQNTSDKSLWDLNSSCVTPLLWSNAGCTDAMSQACNQPAVGAATSAAFFNKVERFGGLSFYCIPVPSTSYHVNVPYSEIPECDIKDSLHLPCWDATRKYCEGSSFSANSVTGIVQRYNDDSADVACVASSSRVVEQSELSNLNPQCKFWFSAPNDPCKDAANQLCAANGFAIALDNRVNEEMDRIIVTCVHQANLTSAKIFD